MPHPAVVASLKVVYGVDQEGFLAIPSTGRGPGVLVLHAWWGLNDTIKGFCTQLAEAGFVAFAPDFYHGKVADTVADAELLCRALDAQQLQARAEIAAATRFLNERAEQSDSGLAVIGFSLGAYYALELAAADPEHIRSVVVFMGQETATSAAQKQPIWVILPRPMRMSRKPASTLWRHPSGKQAAR